MKHNPNFSFLNIVEQHRLFVDDANNPIYLILFEAQLKSNPNEINLNSFHFWTVSRGFYETYSGNASGYSCIAFWKKSNNRKLFKEVINGIEITEYSYTFQNEFISNNDGYATKFSLKKI